MNNKKTLGFCFNLDESIDCIFPKPVPKSRNIEMLLEFGNIRDLRLLFKKGKIIGIRYLNEQAMRLCSELNHFPPNIEKILALKETKKQTE